MRYRNLPDVRRCQNGELPVSMREAVEQDLSQLPESMRRGGIAAVALHAAGRLDEGGLVPRDEGVFLARVQIALAQLREMAPGEVKGDATDEVKLRREKRLTAEE